MSIVAPSVTAILQDPCVFSVAIRTLTLFKDGRAVFNVGGGIVYDSTAEAEYDECLLKARFAVNPQQISC